MNGPAELNAYRAAGLIDRDDVAAAALLVGMARRDEAPEPDTLAWVAICLALRTVRDGHTCVDLARIRDWAGDHDPTAPGGPCWPTDAAPWVEAVRAADRLVGKPGDRRPFILDSRPSADGGAESHRLYLARSLAEEESIATAIRARVTDGTISILLGGPGTGKTTKVAADLVARLQGLKPGEPGPRLGLAAPTGKAAARMTEVLRTRCQEAGAAQDVIDRIAATPARTVHKLLGYNPSRGDRFAHTADNLLPYDLVIVDEASMLSSSLMHHLLSAIDPAADLRLVGDPDQLASVDAGTVLGDIAVFGEESHAAEPLHGCIDTLRKIHRSESANILALAAAIRGAKVDDAIHILRAGADDVAWIDPADAAALDGLEKAATDHARALGNAARGCRGRPTDKGPASGAVCSPRRADGWLGLERTHREAARRPVHRHLVCRATGDRHAQQPQPGPGQRRCRRGGAGCRQDGSGLRAAGTVGPGGRLPARGRRDRPRPDDSQEPGFGVRPRDRRAPRAAEPDPHARAAVHRRHPGPRPGDRGRLPRGDRGGDQDAHSPGHGPGRAAAERLTRRPRRAAFRARLTGAPHDPQQPLPAPRAARRARRDR